MTLSLHLKEPVEKLRAIISESAKFQSITGAADAAEALVFTHAGYAEDKAGDTASQAVKPFPRAIVAHEHFRSVRNGGTWSTAIRLTIALQSYTVSTDRDNSTGDKYLTWLKTVGDIIDDIKEATRDQLLINEVDIVIPPLMQDADTNTNDRKRLWIAQIEIGVGT